MARLWLVVLLAVTSTFTSISPAASRAPAVVHTSQQGSRSQQGQARARHSAPIRAAAAAPSLSALPRLAHVIAADPPATATLDFPVDSVDLSLRAAPNALGLFGRLPAGSRSAVAPVAPISPRAVDAADGTGALPRASLGAPRLPGLAGWALPRAAVVAPDIQVAATTTYSVTNTNDSGPGSLRQAITNADANGGGLITFSVSGTIALQSALPIITQTVSISGSSAPGATPITPTVAINGNALSANPAGGVDGLVFTAANSGVSDLDLNGFNATDPTPGHAIIINGTSAISDVVTGNFIGTDITGATAVSNQVGVRVAGGAVGATITGNLVSGNVFGIVLSDDGTTGNIVQGNKVGTNAAGTAAVPNTNSGIQLQFGAANNTIGGTTAAAANLVSGNPFGITLTDDGTTGNVVQGNKVGTNAAGTAAISNTTGIIVQLGAANNTIGGATAAAANLISGNTFGIILSEVGTTGNTVLGNDVGTDATGMSAIPNGTGIQIQRGASDNTVGGATTASANLIADNTDGVNVVTDAINNQLTTNNTIVGNVVGGNFQGIALQGPATISNMVVGNRVGVGPTGSPLPNTNGISVGSGAMSNTIGAPNAPNLVSGNIGVTNTVSNPNPFATGILLNGVGTTGNIVQSNLVGTNRAGTAALPNVTGIVMDQGASNNIIGGVNASAGNLVSGNGNGVVILGATYPGLTSTVSSSGNVVAGNLIGTNIGGTAAIPNTLEGVGLAGGATGNVIGGGAAAGRNTISGNTAGVVLQDTGTMSNTVDGNFIGTVISGTAALPNGLAGVVVQGGASGNIIGGTDGGNTISGNTRGAGVVIAGVNLVTGQLASTATSGNVVEGNRIGTDPSGTAALSNTIGVVVNSGAVSNTVGGTATNAENVVSGNSFIGVAITGTGALLTPGGFAPLPTNGNLVQGNFVGTNISGTAALGNGGNRGGVGVVINAGAMSNTVGGTASGAGNLISGQGNGFGVYLSDAGSNGNVVQGNKVGTDGAGMSAIRNYAGVFVGGGAANNIIGGATAAAANLVSGNTFGIVLSDAGTTGNTVLGNDVGTDATRTSAIPNGAGIQMQSGASGNTVGGTAPGAFNLVSGNVLGIVLREAGTANNQVLGNLVGTNISGTAALPNQQAGVLLSLGAVSNTIGGPDRADRNIVSGNIGAGIAISDTGTSNNAVLGNLVGTNISGTAALPNTQAGVVIQQGAMSNTVGGTASGAGNVVSGNQSGAGIVITGTGAMSNAVQGNLIGLGATLTPLPNGIGVFLFAGASNNTVGGTASGAANTIAYNGKGVVVGAAAADAGATGNAVLGNSIYSNQALGIDLGNDGVTPNGQAGRSGPDRLQNYPLLSSAQTDGTNLTVSGVLTSTANTTYRVEVFDSPTCDPSGFGQGQVFLGFATVTTDGSGMASFALQEGSGTVASFVTTTATDPNGNTSEFSNCARVTQPSATGTATMQPSGTATTQPSSTSTSTPSATATPTNTNTPTATPTKSPTSTATNTPTNTATSTATNTATSTPTNTAVPATSTPTNTATQAPANTAAATTTPFPTIVPVTPAPTTPVPPVARGCSMGPLLLLRARPVPFSRPVVVVEGLHNTRGEGSSATSRTTLFVSDANTVAFYSRKSYQSLACGRFTLIDLRGTIQSGGTNVRGKRHILLNGLGFRLRITAERKVGRHAQTYSARVEITQIRRHHTFISYQHTFKGLQGVVTITR